MPKPIDPKIKNAVKIAYLGSNLSATAAVEKISTEFRISTRKIWAWIKEEHWDLEKKSQNVITFDPQKPRPERRPDRDGAPIEVLTIVEDTIRDLQADLDNVMGREKAQTANALKGLLEMYRKLKPETPQELAQRVIELGITPAEFVAELKAAGWGAKRA